MPTLTDNDVLSVLNQMDQEQLFFEQMNAARKQVRAVIERYQQAQKDIPRLIAQKAQLEEAVARLAPDLTSGLARNERELAATYASRESDLQAKLAPLQRTLIELTNTVSEAKGTLVAQELAASTKLRDLNAAIAEKTTALADLTASFNEFKRQHGL